MPPVLTSGGVGGGVNLRRSAGDGCGNGEVGVLNGGVTECTGVLSGGVAECTGVIECTEVAMGGGVVECVLLIGGVTECTP